MVETGGRTGDAVLRRGQSISVGDVGPAASRHNWNRSAVAVRGDSIFVGTADGRVVAFETTDGNLEEVWSKPVHEDGFVVSLDVSEDLLVVGERGENGRITALSPDGNDVHWEYETATDIGGAARETFFALPYVLGVRILEDSLLVLARRYERDGQDRNWYSAAYRFCHDGTLEWAYEIEASPISLDAADGLVAVAYNRCPDSRGDGLVVLDVNTGEPVTRWDPDGPGERRVGDVTFTSDGILAAGHPDKFGYFLDRDGTERWRVDLASERDVGGETLYAYPNHVAVAGGNALFVTGNTYATETRDPAGRHPNEHTAVAIDLLTGEERYSHDVRGFARGIAATEDLVAIPSAQNFRERSAETHAVHLLSGTNGPLETRSIEGIASAVSFVAGRLAVVEEPVEYHDEGITRGSYKLYTWEINKPQ